MNNHASHANRPENLKRPIHATAAERPMVAIVPLSQYLKAGAGDVASVSISAATIFATCFPICIAAGETPGTGLPFSRLAPGQIAGWRRLPMRRQAEVGIHSLTRPVFVEFAELVVNGVAATPAAKVIFPVRMISPFASSTSPARSNFDVNVVSIGIAERLATGVVRWRKIRRQMRARAANLR